MKHLRYALLLCCISMISQAESPQSSITMPFEKRANYACNSVVKKLFNLMVEKQTNLCVAADFTSKEDLIACIHEIGSEICVLKTHIDIIQDFDWTLIEQLQALAQQYNFIIMEDRKFCDIGATVVEQYRGGIYHIAQWADITIAHAIAGSGIVEGLKMGKPHMDRACLLVAQMSSSGNLIDELFTTKTVQLAEHHPDFVMGFITQYPCSDNPGFIHMAPGVNLHTTGDALGQQYTTPEAVVARGIDLIIVGRGITHAPDKTKAARLYKEKAWQAYLKRIS